MGPALAGLRELTRLKAIMAAMNECLAQMSKSSDAKRLRILLTWPAVTPHAELNKSAKLDTGTEMKALVATIALLCLSSTVLAHDIYSNLRDRDGRFCCNGQDCRPVQVKVLPNGSYYLPT